MKLLIFLALSLTADTHTFREVNHNGTTLKNVQLVFNNKQQSYSIWYNDKILKNRAYKIVSCKAREGFCLVDGAYDLSQLKD